MITDTTRRSGSTDSLLRINLYFASLVSYRIDELNFWLKCWGKQRAFKGKSTMIMSINSEEEFRRGKV